MRGKVGGKGLFDGGPGMNYGPFAIAFVSVGILTGIARATVGADAVPEPTAALNVVGSQ